MSFTGFAACHCNNIITALIGHNSNSDSVTHKFQYNRDSAMRSLNKGINCDIRSQE